MFGTNAQLRVMVYHLIRKNIPSVVDRITTVGIVLKDGFVHPEHVVKRDKDQHFVQKQVKIGYALQKLQHG